MNEFLINKGFPSIVREGVLSIVRGVVPSKGFPSIVMDSHLYRVISFCSKGVPPIVRDFLI